MVNKLVENIQHIQSEKLSIVKWIGQGIFDVLSLILYVYLLKIDSLLQLIKRYREIRREKNLLLPLACPERIILPLKEKLTTLKTPGGNISILKDNTFTEWLAEWRDIFIKDIYIFTLTSPPDLKADQISQFVCHKLKVLRGEWDQINPQEILRGGLSMYQLANGTPFFSDKQKEEIWNWRLAYFRENFNYKSIDPGVMDRVERDFPNFGDKVCIKPEYRSTKIANSENSDYPNYRTKKEFLKPTLWEGIVIKIRNSGDSTIIVHMLHLWSSYNEDENNYVGIHRAIFEMPLYFVEGLGAASQKERKEIVAEVLDRPEFNLNGKIANVKQLFNIEIKYKELY